MDMKQDDELWGVAYEDFIQECASKKDNLILMRMGIQLLQHIPQSDSLRGGLSSTSSTTPVPNGSTRSAQPNIRRLVASETLDLGAIYFDDVDLRNRIADETAKRKTKQMATMASSLESKAKHLGILENLERVVTNLLRSESVLQGDEALLEAGLTTLKLRKRSVENDMAMLVQSKMRHGPRTCLFYKMEWDAHESRIVNRWLTCLQADMEHVYVMALCEEPGHEHDVGREILELGTYDRGEGLGEELAQKLQPLFGRGLEVVARAVSATSGHLTRLDRVTLPILRLENHGDYRWDLRGLDQEKLGKLSIEVESADTLKRAEDSAAEYILDQLTYCGDDMVEGYNEMFEVYGLLRIRYKESEEGDCPGYTRGSLAWLCKEHVHRGIEAGILEPYPSKYYNPELN